MENLFLDSRGLRRASAAVAMVAGSVLLAAPVAGASAGETPEAAARGQAQAEANAPEQRDDGQATSAAASEQGQEARAERPDGAPPEHSNAGASTSATPEPNNGAAEPESPGASGTHKHTICHRTRSATNPYVVITIDFHAVDGELVEAESDHAERHDGPVFDPATMTDGDAWGDIIPPFSTEDGSFAGQNFGADGRAIFENGCEVPTAETDTGGEAVEEDENDEELIPVEGGDDQTDEPLVVEEQPATDVEGDVVTSDGTPTVGTEVLGTVATPPSDTQVLGAVVTRTPTEVAGGQVSSLPRTGNATGPLAAAGAGLVALGLLLVRGTRRVAPTT